MLKRVKTNLSTDNRATTLIELLIVISLMSMVSLALYYALSNGLRVWERNQQVVLEEEMVIFFEKITEDLQNSYRFSQISFKGDRSKFSFPTIVYTPIDTGLNRNDDVYVNQMGRVEYYFDYLKRGIFKRKANYSQAQSEQYGAVQLMVANVDSLRFKYYYMTDLDEIYSEDILETIPSRIEVEVVFYHQGFQRKMNKFVDIPIGR